MSYDPETWTCSSNEALSISIADDNGYVTFEPRFTYPIFGDSEQIYGYKDLKIKLVFHHQTFLPFVKVTYSDKLAGAEDIQEKLLEFLPTSTVVDDEGRWVDAFTKECETLDKGDALLINKYTKEDEFSIYKFKFANPYAVELNCRLQILVLLFIEAGSYIDTRDTLWDLFVLYKGKTVCGFATAYSYFKYNGAEEFDASMDVKRREKISQFVILPTMQGKHHGSRLYSAILSFWQSDPLVQEVCVEDPNEEFDKLRYRNDFIMLFERGFINKLPLNLGMVTSSWFEEHAQEFKLELNQFKRVVEIGYLYGDHVRLARLVIKRRLFEKNRDGLIELDDATRNDKLQGAYELIKMDYMAVIGGLSVEGEKKRRKTS